MSDTAQIGRLALRQEGDLWCAYYAMPDTMKGALFLGSIRMAIVTQQPASKAAFMRLMRVAVSDIIEERTGARPVWPNKPVAAPEHERGGNA
jgi:hypothetical protein